MIDALFLRRTRAVEEPHAQFAEGCGGVSGGFCDFGDGDGFGRQRQLPFGGDLPVSTDQMFHMKRSWSCAADGVDAELFGAVVVVKENHGAGPFIEAPGGTEEGLGIIIVAEVKFGECILAGILGSGGFWGDQAMLHGFEREFRGTDLASDIDVRRIQQKVFATIEPSMVRFEGDESKAFRIVCTLADDEDHLFHGAE